MAQSPEEFINKLQSSAEQFAKIINDAPFAVIKNVEGQYLKRVFNRGKDSEDNQIGTYKESYKKIREKKGLQTDYVDLQFSGELFNSIKTGTEGDKATLFFDNKNKLEIANHLTEKYKKNIFQPTENEQENATKFMLDYIKDRVQDVIKGLK